MFIVSTMVKKGENQWQKLNMHYSNSSNERLYEFKRVIYLQSWKFRKYGTNYHIYEYIFVMFFDIFDMSGRWDPNQIFKVV